MRPEEEEESGRKEASAFIKSPPCLSGDGRRGWKLGENQFRPRLLRFIPAAVASLGTKVGSRWRSWCCRSWLARGLLGKSRAGANIDVGVVFSTGISVWFICPGSR